LCTKEEKETLEDKNSEQHFYRREQKKESERMNEWM